MLVYVGGHKMIAERSIAVLSDMLDDIKKILFYTIIVVQSIFVIFYGYSIYNNLQNIIFLITYSVLFVLSITFFINSIVKHNSDKSLNKNGKRFLNICKYLVNGTMLVVNVIELVKYGATDISKILLIVSAISLFVQVAIELIKVFMEKHFKRLKLALELDFKFFYKFKEYKGNFYEMLEAPVEKLANWIEKKEPEKSDEEIVLDSLVEKYEKKAEKKKAEKQEKKSQKKLETKQRSHENAEKQKEEFRQHIGVIGNAAKNAVKSIFKRKNNKEDNNE